MTNATETGEVTGTQGQGLQVIWFVEKCLSRDERCHPCAWTKTADELFDELFDHCLPRQRTSFTRHEDHFGGVSTELRQLQAPGL